MKRLEIALLTAFIASGLVVAGCGGSGDTAGTTTEPAAAAAPAASGAPAAQPAAAGEPAGEAAADEPSPFGKPGEDSSRFVPPVRGMAYIMIENPRTRVVGNEVVTSLRIKNVSNGAIALLRVDETWYDKAGNALPGDSQRWRKPFMPQEVIEIELRVPKDSKFFQNTFQFTHANGKVDVKTVKKLEAGQ